MITNYLTVDFEEWYQGLTSTSSLVNEWNSFEKRIEVGSSWLLENLSEAGVKATFFIVGKVAEERPELVRRISEEGHEIGIHGCYHQRISTMSREEFFQDLEKNIVLVEQACGERPVGFRAPYFSFSEKTDWAWEVFGQLGILFDSSIFPIKNPLYGMPGANREPYDVQTKYGSVREFPMTTVRVAGVNLPFSGGFYFRTLPYLVVRNITRFLNTKEKSAIFYFHPWEFDPDHPKPKSLTLRERLSHYGGLSRTRGKFQRLLGDFNFAPLGTAVGETDAH
jgi:polysaccharide deacetylase family protein (PEP-CTERM system associated)